MADSNEWQDEEEDEEEEDFVPGVDDEDDGDYDLEEDEEEDDPNAIPSFLEGILFLDPVRGTLCYEQEGVFCLVCQSSMSPKNFDFNAPPTGNPLMFAGWIQNPSNWMEFFVEFSRQPVSDDPLEEKLLKAQEERNAAASLWKSCTGSKTSPGGDDPDDVKVAACVSDNMKVPPSISPNDETSKMGPPPSNLKVPPSYSLNETKAPPSPDYKDSLVVITARQIKEGDNDNSRTFTFRGAYRSPVGAAVERLCVISSVQVEELLATTAAAAHGTGSGGAVAGTSAAAAASRKRRRSGSRDDDSEERGGVEYQELIDLHDDAGLSTEELRRRYYGGGVDSDKQDSGTTASSRKPTANKPFSKAKEDSTPFGGKDDGSDDDDDYGF
jgi:hypothetical protein